MDFDPAAFAVERDNPPIAAQAPPPELLFGVDLVVVGEIVANPALPHSVGLRQKPSEFAWVTAWVGDSRG
jgi:hypothetical protein